MDAHERLREKLDLFPLGFPKQPETEEILRLLFSDKEALLASKLEGPPLMQTAGLVARRAKMKKAEAAELLEGLAEKGLILSKEILGQTRYMLLPAYPGFIEAQFFAGQEFTDDRKRVGELWHLAYNGALGKESHGYPTSTVRVIPIQRNIDTTQRIFKYEELETIIKTSGTIAVTDCACRKTAGRCDQPIETCLLFGALASYSVEKGVARKLDTHEAMKIIAATEEAGLVHTTQNCKPPVSIICNCCSCCCSSLKGITALGKPAESVASNFVCQEVAGSECKKCKKCVKACQFEAITMTENRAEVDAARCVGCGVCVSVCGIGALTMKRNSNKKPFPSNFHLMAKMYEERGKLPRLLDDIRKRH